MAQLCSITVYPVKSLPGVSVQRCGVTAAGALRNDRRFALTDLQGKFINGKKHPRIISVRASYAEDLLTATFTVGNSDPVTFHLQHEAAAAAAWFSGLLGVACTLHESPERGFPDDTEANGPTLASMASVAAITEWFPEISAAEAAQRFRVNLLIDGLSAFEEDELCSSTVGSFSIGSVRFTAKYPCRRCSVPPRHPVTGVAIPDFVKHFSSNRTSYSALSPAAKAKGTDYLFSINTCIPMTEAGKYLYTGDTVQLPY